MADTKLSGLASLLGANVQTSTDVLYIAQTSTATSKKILVSELFNASASLTFNVTLNGCTTSPTSTAVYSLTNNVATVFIPNMAATSSTTDCTFSGLPTAIVPATTHQGLYAIVKDNGVAVSGACDITNTSTIALRNGVALALTGFTSTGTKGLGTNLTVSYNLN